jgi:hypothetical protein
LKDHFYLEIDLELSTDNLGFMVVDIFQLKNSSKLAATTVNEAL